MVRIQEALTALAFAGLAWVAVMVVLETRLLDDRSIVLRWAIWPIQLALPIAFGAAFLRHGAYALFPASRPVERGEADLPATLGPSPR